MKLQGQLIALMWGEIHMQETICGCDHFLSIAEKTDLLRHSLISGIVTSYTRSFVENEGLSSIRAKFEKFEDPEMKREHDRICEARRMIYGHRDTLNETSVFDDTPSAEEMSRVIVTLHPSGEGDWEIRRSSFPDLYVQRIRELAAFQYQRIRQATHQMLDRYLTSAGMKPGVYVLNKDK